MTTLFLNSAHTSTCSYIRLWLILSFPNSSFAALKLELLPERSWKLDDGVDSVWILNPQGNSSAPSQQSYVDRSASVETFLKKRTSSNWLSASHVTNPLSSSHLEILLYFPNSLRVEVDRSLSTVALHEVLETQNTFSPLTTQVWICWNSSNRRLSWVGLEVPRSETHLGRKLIELDILWTNSLDKVEDTLSRKVASSTNIYSTFSHQYNEALYKPN